MFYSPTYADRAVYDGARPPVVVGYTFLKLVAIVIVVLAILALLAW